MYAKPLSVLLVDDDKINTRVAQRVLAALGQDLTISESGDEALALLAEKKFDLVLMDLLMPRLSGFETTQLLRQITQHAHTPVIALSDRLESNSLADCLAAGMSGAISKPLRTQELKKVFSQFLGPLKAASEPRVEAVPLPEVSGEILSERILLGLRAIDDNEGVFVNELIDLFIDLTPPVLIRLFQAIDDGREADSVSQAHKLKGMCRNLGIVVLAATMDDIEMSYALLTPEKKKSLPARVQSEFEEAVSCLKAHWYQKNLSAS